MMIKRVVIIFVAVVILSSVSAFAAVNITGQTGTLQLTMPDGTIVTVEPGQAMPAIPNGTIIVVLSGFAQISVTDDSVVTVQTVSGSTTELNGGDTITSSKDATTGSESISWVAGDMTVTEPNGSQMMLNQDNPTYDLAAELYSPPELPADITDVDTSVQGEESARDISQTT